MKKIKLLTLLLVLALFMSTSYAANASSANQTNLTKQPIILKPDMSIIVGSKKLADNKFQFTINIRNAGDTGNYKITLNYGDGTSKDIASLGPLGKKQSASYKREHAYQKIGTYRVAGEVIADGDANLKNNKHNILVRVNKLPASPTGRATGKAISNIETFISSLLEMLS